MSRFERQDELNHPRNEVPEFTQLVEKGLSRRRFLGGAAALGAAAFFTVSPLSRAVAAATKASPLMGFAPVPASTKDTITVPAGYQVERLVSWGDPLFGTVPEFSETGNSADAQAGQFGDNNDGMSFFALDDNTAILAVNNEYCNYEIMFPHQGKNMSADDVKCAQAAHGVSIMTLQKQDGRWRLTKDGKYNRRIHANTPMAIGGPAKGHPLLQTAADPKGEWALGTFNNCANGMTPWGTYLTCEENFNGYFGSQHDADITPAQARYGIGREDAGWQWHTHDSRFDLAEHPNEANRFGWVVEIDPKDPDSMPVKRTALGRFKHENAELVIDQSGHAVVYLGDDERGEHLYRFVSKHKYNPDDQAANRNLLDEGTLYVAKFHEGQDGELRGKGEWLELTHGKNGLTAENGFASQADVLIHARLAATQVGATTMDRPEWVAAHPHEPVVFCTLTNNKNRGVHDNQPVGGPNPRAENHYGQILRWRPAGGNHTASEFDWDLFVLAGNPTVHGEGLYAGSANINADNMFNSPDGIGFDQGGRLWIQTDGNYSNQGDFAGQGNNQMLCADPNSGEIRRFLTGPVACEVTGLAFTPDYKTLFVGIQHPGEDLAGSHFPLGGNSKPRSSVMMITREDGGIIGA
ncbi:PhoX family protein [Oceanimonas doudoroffii]|uniref:Transcriptional initiation protein Tat n=1 Tax=Oceanimonas doudoroffii TaxID=84158 RepID=A0A233RFQ4_9GAMM|nr:PhoX family phosphatase [Oceanimonas doudoroffii]OXY82232.1 transcriptional initiation protein Tat [Oceanimonas doudoroffii]